MYNLNLTLNDEQLAVMDRIIAQMPYGLVAPLVADINRQIGEQQAARIETAFTSPATDAAA